MICPFGNNRCLCQTCEDSWLNCGESRCIECIDCDTQQKVAHDVELCTGHKPTQGEEKGEGQNV